MANTFQRFRPSHAQSGSLPTLGAGAGLTKYLEAIKAFPLLTATEEHNLARRYGETGDIRAAEKLVTSHLRLVAKIAMGYRTYGLPLADLISEGNLGLMRAIKGFKRERGFRLSTYAMWWIKASISEFVLNSWSIVKIGTLAAQKKLFFALRREKARLNLYHEGNIPVAQAATIAKRLGVTAKDVAEMNQRLLFGDASLNQPVSADAEDERQDLLVDESPNQEALLGDSEERAVELYLMREALKSLPPRERAVIEQRRLAEVPRTLEAIGADFGVSRERVRQIENRAFRYLQAAVKSASLALQARSSNMIQLFHAKSPPQMSSAV